MSGKRETPQIIKYILKVDSDLTLKLVKYVDKEFGPLSLYRQFFKMLELSCHGIPWLVGTFALVFLLNIHFMRDLCVNLFLALLVDIAIVAVVKASTRRRRPSNNMDDMFGSFSVDKFSFPSGHATRAVMLAVLLSTQYGLILPLRLLVLGWSAAICASRVLLRRHHLLDVIGGVVIGWMEALLIIYSIWLPSESTAKFVAFFLDETRAGANYDV